MGMLKIRFGTLGKVPLTGQMVYDICLGVRLPPEGMTADDAWQLRTLLLTSMIQKKSVDDLMLETAERLAETLNATYQD